MNKIFKTKKDRHGKTVVCSELSRSNGKLKSLVLAVAAIGVVPAAQAANVVWESSLSSVQNDILATAYDNPDANGNFLDRTVLKYHNAADIIKITDAAGAAADLSVTANSTNETALNTTKSNTLSLYRPGYTVTLNVPEGDVSAYTTTYTTDPSVLVIQDTDNTAEVTSVTDFLKVTPQTAVPNDATKGIGAHTEYQLSLDYNTTQFSVVDGKLSLADGIGGAPDTYFHVNNTSNAGGDATTNLGAADEAAGATANYAIAAGINTTAQSQNAIAIGNGTTAGFGAIPSYGVNAIAIGQNATAQASDTIVIGTNASVATTELSPNVYSVPIQAITIGVDSSANALNATALGAHATAGINFKNGNGTTTVGAYSSALYDSASAFGYRANASANQATALGAEAEAASFATTAVGYDSNASKDYATAIGHGADALARSSTAMGGNTTVTADATAGIAIGISSNVSATYGTALGARANVTAAAVNATAIGRLAQADHAEAVALGSNSITRAATAETTATVGDITYSGFAGSAPKSVVSFGKAGEERQLVNVAAGNISATSTDAINGSQLYMVAAEVAKGWTLQGNGTDADVVKPGDKVNFINGAATVVTITPDAAGTASEVKVDVAVDDSTIKIVDGKLTATATKPSVTANADGDINFVNTNTTNVTVDPTTGDIKIDVVTTPLTTNATTGKVDTPANPNATATAGDIATAVNNSGWTAAVNKTGTGVSTDKGGDKLVNPGDTVTFIAGNNMNITKDGLNYTIATNENVTFNNVNASNINVGPVSINNVTGINAGNLTITNVAPGVNATDAVNVQQLQDTIANSTTQVINGDGSVTVAPNATNTNVYEITVNTDGQTIGKVTAEDVAKDPTLKEGALKVITTPLTVNNSTGAVNTPTNPNAMATAGDITNAINGSGFTLTAQGANGSLVNPGETVDMKNTDGNIVISKSADSNDVVYNLANDVKVGNSVTTPKVNADAVTIGNVANPSAPSTTLTTVAGGNYNSAGQLIDGTATPALSVGGNQITNVANGAITPTSTDAVNGSQLYALGSNINNKIDQVAGRVEQIGKQADRGAAIAGAMGMLPQPHLPGKSLVAVATTRYRGQQAAAIGYSRLSDNGKHIIKVSGSTGVNSGAGGRSTMVGAAYGYQW